MIHATGTAVRDKAGSFGHKPTRSCRRQCRLDIRPLKVERNDERWDAGIEMFLSCRIYTRHKSIIMLPIMPRCECTRFECFLSDQDGHALCPYEPGSITYTDLSPDETRPQKQNMLLSGKVAAYSVAAVLIRGFITVFACGRKIARTVPFSTIQCIRLPAATAAKLDFRTQYFKCRAIPVAAPQCPLTDYLQILICIETTASSGNGSGNSWKAAADSENPGCARFQSFLHLFCSLTPLRADVYQYNALSVIGKRAYTNGDELAEYGGKGIPSPDTVSFYDLFVNGVVQPKSNYELSEGRLILKTEDLPAGGVPVILLSVRLKDYKNRKLDASNDHYIAVSDGIKKIYTNDDELKEYGGSGIPGLEEVSCFNLYVNGVLQPKAAYTVRKGILELSEIPKKGENIILESVLVRDPEGRPLKAEVNQYIARSHGERHFTDGDKLKIYGSSGIAPPGLSSYQNVFVNGVVQPEADYWIREGLLVFKTENPPPAGAPITLQSVSLFL